MENKIFVMYISVLGIRSEDIKDFVNKVSSKIMPSTFQGEIIIIPTQSPYTTIDCINPKYITDAELIGQHTVLMQKLNEELKNQLEIIKQNKNE